MHRLNASPTPDQPGQFGEFRERRRISDSFRAPRSVNRALTARSGLNIKPFATQTPQDTAATEWILHRARACLFGAYRLMFASFRAVWRGVPRTGPAVVVALTGLVLAGCAKQPSGGPKRSSEFFPSSVYGPASPRVVGEGQPVPRGGGQRLVGRPYTVAGKQYVPREMRAGTSVSGKASWYGSAFHGRRTANGEVYDMRALSAAHPTMPLPSYARVTNVRNGHSVIVRVNDRGPFHSGRVLDVSQKVAEVLAFRNAGTGYIKVDYIGPASLAGSDDARLIASLRTDGTPAQLPPAAPATMIAGGSSEPPASAPERTEVARAAAPAPQPRSSIASSESIAPSTSPSPTGGARLALNGPASPSAASASTGAGVPAFAPMPPRRPLDLATMPGADTPIMAPPPRLRSGASFFAEPSPVTSFFMERSPFGGLDVNGLQPLR